jgi:hypothetical protein
MLLGSLACEPSTPNSDIQLAKRPLNVNNFQGWSQIPNGETDLGPAITSAQSSSRLVVVRAINNDFFVNFWAGTSIGWLGWEAIPGFGFFTSRPGATTWGQQHYAVVGKGSDDTIFINVTTGTGHMSWSGWQRIPGATFDTAAAVAYVAGSGSLYVVARKSNGRVYWSRNVITGDTYTHGNWTSWAEIPNGVLTAEPAAVGNNGNLVVAGRGTDNAYWTTSFNGSTWGPWTQISGATFSSAPAIASRPPGFLDVFGQGADNKVYVSTFNAAQVPAWGAFEAIANGFTMSPPAAWSRATGKVDLVVRGLDNHAWINPFVE